jgi:hypothetical protein
MDGGLTFRLLTADDCAPAAALLQRVFGGWPRLPVPVQAEDHLRWKAFAHPLAPFEHIVVTGPNGDVLGLSLRLWEWARLDGTRVRYATGGDLALDASIRGQGVYSRMRQVKREITTRDWAFQTAHTSSEVLRGQFSSRGWKPFGNAMTMLRAPAGNLWQRLRGGAGTRQAVITLDGFDERTDTLFERAAAPFRLIVERTAARMTWRYLDRRAGQFTVRARVDGDTVLGYSILRHAGRRGFVADLLTDPASPGTVDALARDAVRFLGKAGARTVRAWLPAVHPYRAAFVGAGFRHEANVDLRHRADTIDPAALAFLEAGGSPYHYTLGDTDIV